MIELPPLTTVLLLPQGEMEHPHPEVPADSVIILPTHMGSSVYKYERGRPSDVPDERPLADAGRKGQGVADRMGCPVIVYDRPPGTSNQASGFRVTEGNARDVAGYTGDAIATLMHQNGFEHAILAGNSAAVPPIVELALSGTLPVTHLSAMDVVGSERHTLAGGVARWALYTAFQEGRIEKPPRTDDDKQAEAVGLSARGFLLDSWANQAVWKSTRAAEGLRSIAANLGDIAVRVEIPD